MCIRDRRFAGGLPVAPVDAPLAFPVDYGQQDFLIGAALLPEIYQLEDVALLQAVQDSIEVADTPEDLRQVYRRQ